LCHSSGRALRFYLARQVRLHRIHAYDARALDVTRLEETIDEWSVVVFTNEKPHPSDAFEFSTGGDLLHPNETTQMTYARLNHDANWRRMADLNDNGLMKSYTLEDFFFIRSGWDVPAAKFFVQPEARAWALGIQPMHMNPLLPSPDAVADKVIAADEVGYPVGENRPVVLAANK